MAGDSMVVEGSWNGRVGLGGEKNPKPILFEGFQKQDRMSDICFNVSRCICFWFKMVL